MSFRKPRTNYIRFKNEDLSWCLCWKNDSLKKLGDQLNCKCGEELEIYEWNWDDRNLLNNVILSNNNRDVLFHPVYSSGTGIVRGQQVLEPNKHYYWEIKMLTNLYGTDIMVGVGTKDIDFFDFRLHFCSVLGYGSESWGYSYTGHIQQSGLKSKYGSRYSAGSLIGVHLDMCAGTLEYYLNREPMGVAFCGLRNYKLYPMVCSTAAQSSMRITCAISEKPTLQLACLRVIRKNPILLEEYWKIPGICKMMSRKYFWLAPQKQQVKDSPLELEDEVVLSDSDSRKRFCTGLAHFQEHILLNQALRKAIGLDNVETLSQINK